MEYKKFYKTISLISCRILWHLMKQGNITKISKLHGGTVQCPVSTSVMKLLALAPIKYARRDTKKFQSIPTLLDFLIFLKTFCTGLLGKTVKNKTDIFKKHLTIYSTKYFPRIF